MLTQEMISSSEDDDGEEDFLFANLDDNSDRDSFPSFNK